MTPEVGMISLIVAIVVHALVLLFKSPKEVNSEMAKRLGDVEQDHELLARRFERHDEVVKNLIEAINRLTSRIDKLEPYYRPPGRRGN